MPPAAHQTLLSARETEVLRVCARGMSNEEIGDQLAVTVGTIKGHLVSVYRKLKVRNRTGAVAKARQLGLLKQEATMSTTTRRQAVIDNQPDAPGYPAEDTRYPSARV